MAIEAEKLFRYEEVKESLLVDISSKRPGAKVGSVKQLMQRYGVSQATVDRAIQGLKDEGLIESRVGRGLFVADCNAGSREKLDGRIDVLFFGTEVMFRNEGFHKELITELGRFLGGEGSYLRLSTIPRFSSRREIIEKIDSLSPSAILTMYITDVDVLDILARRRIPALHLMPYCPTELKNSFYLDNRAIIRMNLDCLIKAGHKDIAFFYGKEGNEYNRDMSERLQFFYEEMARNRIIADPDLVVESGFDKSNAYEATNVLFSRGKKFTAIICDDHQASGVYQALQARGLRVGEDISVVGIDDLSWAAQMHPSLTTVRISRMELAKLAIVELKKMLEGKSKGFSKIYIPSKLIKRDSVREIL